MLQFAVRAGLLAGLLLLPAAAQADIVYLNDGTVLHGKVVVEKESFDDPFVGSIVGMKAGGFYAVVDGARIVIFPTKNLGQPGENTDIRADHVLLERENPRARRQLVSGEFRRTTPWNERGERTLSLVSPVGTEPVRQRLTILTPHHLRISAVEFNWHAHYLTSEFDADLVRKLSTQFEKIAEKDGKPDAAKRLLLIKFLRQARLFDLAEKEIARMEVDLPSAKNDIADAREALKIARAEQLLEEVNGALKSGQPRLANHFLQKVPREGIGALNVQATAARVRLENIGKQLAQVQRFLRVLPDDAEGDCAEILCDAAAAIRDEVSPESLDRLEPFLNLAEQAERARQAMRVPAQQPEQLLALAVTGWLLGRESAETKPEAARKLWKARRFVQESMTVSSPRVRNQLVARYLAGEPVQVEELARLVAFLPPPDPEPTIKDELVAVKRQTGVNLGSRKPTDYALLTPIDYRHGRACPLLVVLPHRGEDLDTMIKRYAAWAVKAGYLLAAVDWNNGGVSPYGYTAEEHFRVLDTIRDIKQHFNVDSDRVFLSGFGEGANASWDIGLSHPDQFAGVAPISGQPSFKYIQPYAANAANLPFYVVTGDLAGDAPKTIMKVTQPWMANAYQVLAVYYRGRGVEWFAGEMPFLFDWFSRRKRVHPHPALGFRGAGDGGALTYKVARDTDNRHYWLSTSAIADSRVFGARKDTIPAQMQATILPDNTINVFTSGVKDVSISLSPGMIDFSKPVKVRLVDTPRPVWNSKVPLPLDLRLMMDDLYDRYDTRRPVIAQIGPLSTTR